MEEIKKTVESEIKEINVPGSSIQFLFREYNFSEDLPPGKIPCTNLCPLVKYCERIPDPSRLTNPKLTFMDFCCGLWGDILPIDNIVDLKDKYKAIGVDLFGSDEKFWEEVDIRSLGTFGIEKKDRQD